MSLIKEVVCKRCGLRVYRVNASNHKKPNDLCYNCTILSHKEQFAARRKAREEELIG